MRCIASCNAFNVKDGQDQGQRQAGEPEVAGTARIGQERPGKQPQRQSTGAPQEQPGENSQRQPNAGPARANQVANCCTVPHKAARCIALGKLVVPVAPPPFSVAPRAISVAPGSGSMLEVMAKSIELLT